MKANVLYIWGAEENAFSHSNTVLNRASSKRGDGRKQRRSGVHLESLWPQLRFTSSFTRSCRLFYLETFTSRQSESSRWLKDEKAKRAPLKYSHKHRKQSQRGTTWQKLSSHAAAEQPLDSETHCDLQESPSSIHSSPHWLLILLYISLRKEWLSVVRTV